MPSALPAEGLTMDAALVAWQRKATNVLLIASAAGHLLPVILLAAGYAAPVRPWFKAAGLMCYLVMVASAVLRRVDWRIRLGAYFVAAYTTVALASVSPVQGAVRERESCRPTDPRPGPLRPDRRKARGGGECRAARGSSLRARSARRCRRNTR